MSIGVTATSSLTTAMSVTDFKAHARIAQDSEDGYITDLLLAVTERVEAELHRSLVNRTWAMTLDCFPHTDTIILPRAPVSSVTSVVYRDANGSSQTFADTNYRVSTATEPGRITLKVSKVWPQTDREIDAVVVTFIAGYGSSAKSIPPNILHLVRLIGSHWYENREPVVVGTIVAELPMSAQSLIQSNKVHPLELV